MQKFGEHKVNGIDSFFRTKPSNTNIREGESVSYIERGFLVKLEKRNGVVYESRYLESGKHKKKTFEPSIDAPISAGAGGDGDITSVTAGTGLSGGGSTGAISLSIDSTVTTLTGTQTLTNKTLTSPTLTTPALGTPASGVMTNVTGTASGLTSGKVTVTDSDANTAFPLVFHDESNSLLDDTSVFTYNPNSGTLLVGNLTVNGTTTTVDTTNTTIKDNLLELNSGASSNSNDVGIIIQRGSTGNDALLMWDESEDKWTLGTSTSSSGDTGNLNLTAGTLVADIEGDLTGDVTGNADTATLATSFTSSANNSTDETVYPVFVDGATGTQGAETDTGLTYNPSSGNLSSTQLTGTLQTASQTNITAVGTIGTGTWQATEVGLAYGGTELVGETDGKIVIADGSGAPTHLDVGSSSGITILGTIATGVWQGTAVADGYVANDLTISGGTVNNSVIGGSTPAAITGTTIDANTDFTIGSLIITDDQIQITPSSSDTVTISGATNGILNITTVDAAGTAGDINFVADGQIEYRANDAAGHIFDINGTNQVTITDGLIAPVSNNDIDLGSDSLEFKDIWIDGTAYLDSATITTADITSIYNTSLKLGTASDQEWINFGTSNTIEFGINDTIEFEIFSNGIAVNEGDKVIFDGITLGDTYITSNTGDSMHIVVGGVKMFDLIEDDSQDMVIVGNGTSDVDFIVDDNSGDAAFTVQSSDGAVTVAGALTTNSLSTTNLVGTNVIANTYKYNNSGSAGATAFTIGASGGVSFTQAIALGNAVFEADSTDGAILSLKTTLTEQDQVDILGRIDFSAPVSGDNASDDSRKLAASIVAQKSAVFSDTSNQTDMIFQLGVSEIATEKFRILSDGKIKIGNAYTLPAADGSANQILKTNGSGVVSFAAETDTNTTYTAGTGLDLSSTEFSVDVSDFMANGSNNYVLTATGTDAFRGEGNLTFDGSTLAVTGALTTTSSITPGSIVLGGHSFNDIDIGSEFVDADDHLMTSGAIKEKIESYGYTTTGAITALNNATANELVTVGSTTTELDAEANLTFDGTDLKLLGDNLEMRWGDSQDFKIYVDTVTAYLKNVTQDGDIRLQINDGGSNLTAIKIDGSEVGRVLLPNDNQQIRIGADQDLRFYHDGNSHIQNNSTGNLYIDNYADDNDIFLRCDDGSGGVTAYLTLDGGNTKVQIDKNMVFSDNVQAQFGGGVDLRIYHDGSHNYIDLDNGNLYFRDDGDNNIFAIAREGNGVQLYEGSITLQATGKLRLDGNTSGDTYIYEQSGNDLHFIVGNENHLQIDVSNNITKVNADKQDHDFQISGDDDTELLYLDAGNDRVGISTSSPGNLLTVNSTTLYQASIQYDASTRLRISVESSGKSRLYTDNSANVGIESGGLYVQPTNRFYLDGGNDTYIAESSGNVMSFYAGGSTIRANVNTSGLNVPDNGYIAAGDSNDIFIRHDGNGHLQSNAGVMYINNVAATSMILSTNNTTAITIDSSQNLQLEDGKELKLGGNDGLRMQGGNSNCFIDNYTGAMFIREHTDNGSILLQADNGSGGLVVYLTIDGSNEAVVVNEDSADIDFRVESNGNANMIFVDGGNDKVGIGTNSPDSYNNDGDEFVIYGTGNTGMSIASGTSSNGSIMFADGTGGTAGYRGAIKYNHGSDYMHFNTAAAERMRLESDGDLHLTADVVAYSSTPSDIRLKKNFEKIENGLDVVNKLEGHTFNWKKDDKRLSAGFKAQEVEKILPHLVDEKELPLRADDDKKYKVLRYEEIIPYLVEAIKEQQIEIDCLKANLDQLKYNRR